MRTGLYTRLALDGIRRNRQTYLPYMLACGGTVGMHYVVSFIHHSKTVASMRGGAMFCSLMELGEWILAVFACIFLFYTNSFLMRRRRREFGLYNVLGMGKPHIGRILLYETVITAVLSVASGLFVGILISKLAELAVVRMAGAEATFDFTVSAESVLTTAAVFSAIFLLLYLKSLAGLRFAGAAELLKSEAAGEKPPKANWLLGLAGVVILAAAYYLAVSITNPLDAIVWFFVAVILVIIGTYLLLVAGSVLLCRVLQKNKKYYYRPEHFVSVSSMAYRMKRNGAGLASVCIIAYIVSTADYAARTGENVSLAPDEVLLLTYKCSYERPTLTLAMDDVSHTWRVADVRNGYFLPPKVGGLIAQMTLIVNDTASAVQDFRTYNGHVVTMQYKWVYNFNTDLGDEECVALTQGVMRTLGEVEPEQGYMYLLAECRAEGSADFYGSNGALFFIGIMLTLVFMLAAVLILYYKQISEGYEDQKRFEIMQKVGMTKKEIRRSINSQLLTVFFLPLLLAGVHLAFAFPMIRRLLVLFSLYNVGLFVTTTLVSFGAFALLYTIVYRLTAKAYYNIVSA